MLFILDIFFLQTDYQRDDDEGTSWGLIIFIILFALALLWFLLTSGKKILSATNWHHHFDNCDYSTQVFYESLEKTIAQKSIPGVEMKRVSYSEGGLLSANREYLYVVRKRKVFAVCAAPFGKNFFVSWWHFETPNPNHQILFYIPYLGARIYKLLQLRTFYQLDTEQLYKQEIHQCVLEVVRQMTEEKSIRGLTADDCKIKEEMLDAAYAE